MLLTRRTTNRITVHPPMRRYSAESWEDIALSASMEVHQLRERVRELERRAADYEREIERLRRERRQA